MNRRSFIRNSMSLAALSFCRPGVAFAAPHGEHLKGTPNLIFGLLSDIHVRLIPGKNGVYFTEFFKKSLELFRDNGADAVVAAGDLINSGVADEFQAFADTWFSVFPDDKAPDGRKVERIFVCGNHDVSIPMARRICNNDKNEMKKRAIALDKAKWWKKLFNEEFSEIYRKNVKGYDFIGAHWEGGLKGRDDSFCKEIEPFYEKIAPTLDKSKPFFHVQHPHPKGTCHGNEVWGQDDGVSTKVLSKFPNAIAFSGHSHNSLLDEKLIWQGAFTSVGTATASHIGLSSLRAGVPGGYENYKSTGRSAKEKAAADRSKVMPMLNRTLGRQAQLVRVYDDRIVFTRYDLYDLKPLAEDLVLPLTDMKVKPFAYEPRYAVAKIPQFPKDAKITVKKGKALRRGIEKKGRKTDAITFTAPAANAEPSAKGVYYKLVAEADGKSKEFAIIHDSFRFRAEDARSEAPVKFCIATDRLPKGEVTFKLSGYSWWNKKSEPLEVKCSIV